MDIELFISEIQSRPAIWDSKSDSYSNRGEKVKAWEEICELFVGDFSNKTAKEKNIEVTKLQRKWKSLRDSFNRENAKNKNVASGSAATSSKQYIYFNHLSFLNSLKEVRPPTDVTNATNDAETSRPKINRNINIKRAEKSENEILRTLSENLKRKHDQISDQNDPDKQFLMSLLPHVKKIDENCKLDFQSEILQLIRKYTHNQNYETYSAQYYGYSSGNANIHKKTQKASTSAQPSPLHSHYSDKSMLDMSYSTENASTSIPSSPIIQPSPTHSYYSDQSMDNSSVIEDMFRDDDE
ncbi:uncharacterized protein LOC126978858 [Leptidea sinapis]|uniref:uncharacterized protein LOC126973638 n=1 Tax=Leptidea sinapis TaxID=189913 RepID=UPI0021C276C6|nr:uncharacterized protein LOC126973638 [Leptidea sinapis]XP_050683928.1 uncharacterized protein LOC126978858 [Leptidea sinapis]